MKCSAKLTEMIIIPKEAGNKAISKKTGSEFPIKIEIPGSSSIIMKALVQGKWRSGTEFLDLDEKKLTAIFYWRDSGQNFELRAEIKTTGKLKEYIEKRAKKHEARKEQEYHDKLSQSER